MGRKKNIYCDIEKILAQIKKEGNKWKFIDLILGEVRQYNNIKQTCELLARIASDSNIKDCEIEDKRDINFAENARELLCDIGAMDKYRDPDKDSLLLYIVWARYLMEKGIINDYKICYENNAFLLEGYHKARGKTYRLGTDGISIKKIEKHQCNEDVYKSLGSFLIWPRHDNSINQKKGMQLNDSWGAIMQKVHDYYEKRDASFFTSAEDKDWLDYLGSFDREKSKWESFCSCYELDCIINEEEIPDELYVKSRNEKMWESIL